MSGPVIEAANVSKILGSGPARVQALKDVNPASNDRFQNQSEFA
jgi:hypothetical protein